MDDRRGRRPGPRPKGICPVCGQLRHLRDSGLMGMHHRLACGHYNIGVCPGVDQPALLEGPEMPEATAPKPAVGRIVHYVSHGTPLKADGIQEYSSTCRAAIITEAYYEDFNCTIVTDDVASLAVLNPTGIFFADAASHDEDNHRGGTWHWPERV